MIRDNGQHNNHNHDELLVSSQPGLVISATWCDALSIVPQDGIEESNEVSDLPAQAQA
jgi:hypothetical protein